MKAIAVGILALLLKLATFAPVFADDVSVKGYFRRDGTYVQPHMRSAPDSSYNNNWSTSPNVNPYTGQQGTRQHGCTTPIPGTGKEVTMGSAAPNSAGGLAGSGMTRGARLTRARCSSRPGDVGSRVRYDEERHQPDWWPEKIRRE